MMRQKRIVAKIQEQEELEEDDESVSVGDDDSVSASDSDSQVIDEDVDSAEDEAASVPDSDDDDDDYNDDDGENDGANDDDDHGHDEKAPHTNLNTGNVTSKSKTEKEVQRIYDRYNMLKGKQLYVHFPRRLPEDEEEFQQMACRLSPLIVRAQKPRQKYARFCLLNFKNQTDRDAALIDIREAIKAKREHFEKLHVSMRRTERPGFVQRLVEKKLKSIEKKKAKEKQKRATRLATQQATKQYTSAVVILNMPKAASLLEIRQLFPNAVDIQVKTSRHKLSNTSIVYINLPSTQDAREAVHKPRNYNGTRLLIRYNTKKSNVAPRNGNMSKSDRDTLQKKSQQFKKHTQLKIKKPKQSTRDATSTKLL